jgi:hypothetical protein
MSEAFAVKRIINSGGSLKYAEMFLAYKEKKNKEYELQVQTENMQLNAKNAQETEQLKAKNAQEAMALELQNFEKKTVVETDQKIRLEEVKHKFKMEEDIQMANMELKNMVIANQSKPVPA